MLITYNKLNNFNNKPLLRSKYYNTLKEVFTYFSITNTTTYTNIFYLTKLNYYFSNIFKFFSLLKENIK